MSRPTTTINTTNKDTNGKLVLGMVPASQAGPSAPHWVLVSNEPSTPTIRGEEKESLKVSLPDGSARVTDSQFPSHRSEVSLGPSTETPPSMLDGIFPNGRVRGKSGRVGGSLPPPLLATAGLKHTFRFVSSYASAVPVTFASLTGAIGSICTVANSKVQPWASSIRLVKVTVWPAPSSSAASTAELYWSNGTSAQVPDEARITTIPEGVTVTRALTFVPPRMSLAADWLVVPATIFTISSPVGSVVDVTVQFRLSNIFEVANITVVTGTLGTVYYLALDGPSTNKYIPQGLPTTS